MMGFGDGLNQGGYPVAYGGGYAVPLAGNRPKGFPDVQPSKGGGDDEGQRTKAVMPDMSQCNAYPIILHSFYRAVPRLANKTRRSSLSLLFAHGRYVERGEESSRFSLLESRMEVDEKAIRFPDCAFRMPVSRPVRSALEECTGECAWPHKSLQRQDHARDHSESQGPVKRAAWARAYVN